ncbi:peroxiredoxin-like family protein [Shewanella fidelis]|uniref:Peroxiredoxin-like family protein n=1 Tax=Shewanella fidelis TaxID=173509 RepID=A0AAW8NRW2_9GAMM|nr:peroxiredoxin-like family protein [Shewanella fidelis]MDR8524921.1 peroxiredoxin-like family protein [Shewanella fidelis]MDW4810992.1 peroxiredoxin-like family protein [Shewanella fidelis]MDW4815229.1 peroxiredoxin-like family protein [Shewanella fidelis]MDW4819319.1 peroxiredoxin-like family protein [Shewanella fidelis]MDW4823003.1 peroxiredoxin-like family protein [Shewanella fidelis]
MSLRKLAAGAALPPITLPTLAGKSVTLGVPAPGCDWQLVVIYRGKHCPLCSRYLTELEALRHDFIDLGVDIVAASADSLEQAKLHLSTLNVSYPIAYNLSISNMQELGLYISNPRSEQETDHPFAEPGLFVINEKGTVQIIDISNGPFVRPDLASLLSGLSFIRDPQNNYPIRGTYSE